MWIFEAHYINMETEEESAIKIEFDGQFFGSEKEAYLYAMGKPTTEKAKRNALNLLNLLHVRNRTTKKGKRYDYINRKENI